MEVVASWGPTGPTRWYHACEDGQQGNGHKEGGQVRQSGDLLMCIIAAAVDTNGSISAPLPTRNWAPASIMLCNMNGTFMMLVLGHAPADPWCRS